MPTGLLSVRSPESQCTVTPDGEVKPNGKSVLSSMAPRLDTLNGKTVYLVDTGFGGSYKFLDQLQAWFAQHMPAIKTVRKRKSGTVFRDDNPALWKEIKDKGDAAVVGVAG
jgi:hypothetical protein